MNIPRETNVATRASAPYMKQRILSAGIVILRRKQGDCRYLLLRSYRYWDFPKGVVESGENPFSAACREAREETALDALDFLWGQVFFETPPYGAGKVARYYVACSETGEIELAAAPQLGRPEHDEFRWVDFRDAGTLLAPRLLPVLDWVHRLTGC